MIETSVIAGVYNIEHCFSFQKSIQSILNQSYQNFEFILCDDGSTDRTWEILCDIQKQDRRIKLLKNDSNQGLATALNKCITASRGRFIARHDCDDYCDLKRLEKQIAYMKEHPDVNVLGCQVYLFDENGVWGKLRYPQKVRNEDFLFTMPYKHGAVVFRKEVLLQVGGYRVSKETYRAEDYDLFMSLQTFCKGENLDEYLYYFCENQDTKHRRKYKYRLDEAKVRFLGFRKLKLLPKGMLYVIKPLVVGMIPNVWLDKAKDKYYKRKK